MQARPGDATPPMFRTDPPAEPSPPVQGEWTPNRRWLVALVGLAVLSRVVWVLWIHPPGDYVFSDMRKYVERAHDLVAHGIHPSQELAWQAWGTHYLLAIPVALFGDSGLTVAALMWGLMAASAVPAAYLLAGRVSRRPWVPPAVGVGVLLWHPNLSNAGYFLSEAPFLCAQLWSTYGLVRVLQQGRWAWPTGMVSAIAFAVRPQSALFFVLVLATWAANHRRFPHVRARHVIAVASPLLLMLGFSIGRFHLHTGRWFGVAQNANMNLTAGRCHNIVTQAFRREAHKRRSERTHNTRDGRRVSLPAFRLLAATVPDDHPFGLRPALGHETIRMVGYIGDPQVHRAIRQKCYARTGALEQLRYSIVNMGLLWAGGRQWPEQSRGAVKFLPPVEVYKYLYLVLLWIPSLVGMVAALRSIRSHPVATLCAWQSVTSMTVAAIFFGTIRLRTPYDPYAMILAMEGWGILMALVSRRWTRGSPVPRSDG